LDLKKKEKKIKPTKNKTKTKQKNIGVKNLQNKRRPKCVGVILNGYIMFGRGIWDNYTLYQNAVF
jgi:hypothetical protein